MMKAIEWMIELFFLSIGMGLNYLILYMLGLHPLYGSFGFVVGWLLAKGIKRKFNEDTTTSKAVEGK